MIDIPGVNQELNQLPLSVPADSRAFQSLGRHREELDAGSRKGGMEKGPGASRQHLEHLLVSGEDGEEWIFHGKQEKWWLISRVFRDRDELWSARATGECSHPKNPSRNP